MFDNFNTDSIPQNGCVDASAYDSITSSGIIENNFRNAPLLYPNPKNEIFSIDLGSNYQTITMTDLNGKLIQSKTYNESQLLNLKLEEPVGVYLLIIESNERKAVIRLVKEETICQPNKLNGKNSKSETLNRDFLLQFN